MTDSEMTLQQLFALPGKALPPSARSTLQSSHVMAALKEALAKQSKSIKWEAVSDVLVDKAVEILDVPLLDIFVGAWKKYREIEEFAEPGKYPPADTQLVALAEHTIKSEHHPYLEVLVKGVPVERINFTVTVALTLEGFILQIQDGKIKAIRTGALKGNGSLALESAVVLEKDFGTVRLPGTFALGEGIPLRAIEPPRARPATAS